MLSRTTLVVATDPLRWATDPPGTHRCGPGTFCHGEGGQGDRGWGLCWGSRGHRVALGTPGTWHVSWGTPLVPWDPSGLGGHLRALGTPRDMACPWGTPLAPQDLKGFVKPKRSVPGAHSSPWGHLQMLGTLRDTSCPWGTPLLHKTPKVMF